MSPDGDKEIDKKKLNRLSDKNFKTTDIDGKATNDDEEKLIADAKQILIIKMLVQKTKDEKGVTRRFYIIIGIENNDKTAN